MLNGNRITIIRILAAAIISMITVVVAGYLIAIDREIPAAWWAIATIAVGGVVGTDILTSYLTKGKPQ